MFLKVLTLFSVHLLCFCAVFGLISAQGEGKGPDIMGLKAAMASGETGSSPAGDYTALVQVNIRCVNDPINGLVCAAEYPDKCSGVNVRCVNDQLNGLVCAAEYPDKCSEQWNFPNPCTQLNIDQNITKFVHPFDKTKFLMCGELGKLYVVQCPQYETFHEGCGQCVGEVAGMTASCEVPLPPIVDNPCTREAILANKLFFPFPRNLSMFIHCDVWGKPWERICTPGEVWSQWDNTCVLPHLLNPCNRPTTNLNYLYKHPCNPRMYLQCDTQARPHEVLCPIDTAFAEIQQQCVSYQSFPTTADFTAYCESVIFGFRTNHGNDGVPLPTNALDAALGQGATSSGTTNFVDMRNVAGGQTGGFVDMRNVANQGLTAGGQKGGFVDMRNGANQGLTAGGQKGGFVEMRNGANQGLTAGGQTGGFVEMRTGANQGLAAGGQTGGFVDMRKNAGGQTGGFVDMRNVANQGLGAGGQTGGFVDMTTGANQGLTAGGQTSGFVDMRNNAGGQTGGFVDVRNDANQGLGAGGQTGGLVDIRNGANQGLGTNGQATWHDVRTDKAQGGNAFTSWQDIRPKAGANTGFSDVRTNTIDTSAASGALSAGSLDASATWKDVRVQPTTDQGTTTNLNAGFVDVRINRTPGGFADVRNTNAATTGDQTGSSSVAVDPSASAASTIFKDIRPPSGTGTAATNFKDIRPQSTGSAATTNFKDIRPLSGGGAAATNFKDIRPQSTGSAATTNFKDIRPLSGGGAAATNFQDIRPQSTGGAPSTNFKDMRPLDTGNFVVDTSGASSAINWNDIRGQSSAANGKVNISDIPTLDLRNQLGGSTNQVGMTNTEVVGASASSSTGSSGKTGTGSDKTMQQLLNTWNRIITGGGNANAGTQQGSAASTSFEIVDNIAVSGSGNFGGVGNMGNTQTGQTHGQSNKLHPSQMKMYEFSTIPFSEPCTLENLDQGRTHFRLKNEPHYFLQCGTNGLMHKMPCSTVGKDWFDVYTNTCVDGPVHLPV